MDSSEWTELAKITARLDELRKLLDAAEDATKSPHSMRLRP